jgi:hypothetical protein
VEPEVVFNLWVFIQSIGPFQVIHELGVRPYVMRGSDDEMTRLLKELAVSDFHFARRYPLPAHYHLKIRGEGGHLTASTSSDPVRPGEEVRKGLALVRPDIAGMQQMEYFSEALDAAENALPTRRIGLEGRTTMKPTVNRRNLLSVITNVNIDDDGNQVARVDDTRRHWTPEPAVNLWAFHDEATRADYALAGRAYMIHGSEAEKTRILKTLASIDFSLAPTLRVPERFAVSGGMPAPADNVYNRDLFDEVFADLDRQVPAAVGMDGKIRNSVKVATRQTLLVATRITETKSGVASAIPTGLI